MTSNQQFSSCCYLV